MDQRVIDIRNSNWVHIIQDRQESGLSIKKWCAQNHIGEGSYYYHLHKLRMLALEDSGNQQESSMELLETAAPVADNAFVPVAVNDDTESHDGVSLRVTGGQFVTMMYNKAVADYKAGKSTTDPSKAAASGFSDVGSSAYYASAVNWASANGIAQGTSTSTFNPNGTVTRAEAVTFLQRWLGGSSAASTQFSDVASNSYYAGAVGWAVKNGVTNGTSAATFEPGTKCNRGQAATFIYRAAF